MSESFLFHPNRRSGTIFHIFAIFLLAAAGLFSLYKASQAEVGPVFVLYLVPALLALGLTPYLIYQLRGLQVAGYEMERDGLRLQWGLRIEDLPIDAIQWVRPAEELKGSLPLPALRWPGHVVGVRKLPDQAEVEYLASQVKELVLIATRGKIYAISPANQAEFLDTYQRLTELGSLAPIPARSVYPNFLLSNFWSDLPARGLLLGGLALSLLLLLWVSLVVPAHPQISFRLSADGSALEYVPSVRLFLLPVLNGSFFLADLLGGLFFYRRREKQPLAYIVWGSGVLTSLLFLGATFFILKAS